MSFDFDGIENAEVFETGNYFPPDGKFKCSLIRILVKKTQRSGPAFIAELKIEESNLEEVKSGTTRTFYQGLSDTNVAYPTILGFMSALLGVDSKDKEEFSEFKSNIKEILNEAGNFEGEAEDHPLYGETVEVETYNKVTQKGSDFTVHKWAIWKTEEAAE